MKKKDDRCPGLVPDRVELIPGETKTVKVLLNDFIGTDDKIEDITCDEPADIETTVLHNSDGFPDVIGRPLDEVKFRALVAGKESKPTYLCRYQVKNSRGGKRSADVEVRIAKDFVVLMKSEWFTAANVPQGFLACPDYVHWNLVGGRSADYSTWTFEGETTFDAATSINCSESWVECVAGTHVSTHGATKTINPFSHIEARTPSDVEGLAMSFAHPYGSGSEFTRRKTSVDCSGWRFPGKPAPCKQPSAPPSTLVCDP